MKIQKLRILILCVCGLWLLLMAAPCVPLKTTQAKASRYILQRQNLGHDNGCELRLFDRQTRHLVWELAVESVYHDPVWSADHQAVALFVNRDPPNGQLLIWQAGQAVRLLPTGSLSTGDLFGDWDGILDVWWSLDKKRVLLRAFYSGGGDSNSGQLLCYVLDKKRFYEGPKGVRRAEWIASQQVRYWRVEYDRPWIKDPLKKLEWFDLPPESKHSQLWRCP